MEITDKEYNSLKAEAEKGKQYNETLKKLNIATEKLENLTEEKKKIDNDYNVLKKEVQATKIEELKKTYGEDKLEKVLEYQEKNLSTEDIDKLILNKEDDTQSPLMNPGGGNPPTDKQKGYPDLDPKYLDPNHTT